MKIKKLPRTFYMSDIYVVVTDTWEEVNKKFNTEIVEKFGAVSFEFDSPYHTVYMVFKSDNIKFKFIPHECVHAVNWIFQNSGVKLDPDNDETQAYFTGWLVDKTYEILKPYMEAKK